MVNFLEMEDLERYCTVIFELRLDHIQYIKFRTLLITSENNSVDARSSFVSGNDPTITPSRSSPGCSRPPSDVRRQRLGSTKQTGVKVA